MTGPTLPSALTIALLISGCRPTPPSEIPTPAPAAAAVTLAGGLSGTWLLTAADEIQPDGARVHSYGDQPAGLLIIDRTGQYSLQIFRRGRQKFASNDKRRGTAEEYADALLGMSTHTGHCFIDPADNRLVFQIELAAYPNWEGTEQRRVYTLTGDALSYQIAPSATGNGTIAISEWRRVR